MAKFEVGKRYDVNGGGVIEVTRKTRCYLTFEIIEQPHDKPYFLLPGRRMHSPFGSIDNEVVLVPIGSIEGVRVDEMLCFAGHEC